MQKHTECSCIEGIRRMLDTHQQHHEQTAKYLPLEEKCKNGCNLNNDYPCICLSRESKPDCGCNHFKDLFCICSCHDEKPKCGLFENDYHSHSKRCFI